jgi:hypothetical protein
MNPHKCLLPYMVIGWARIFYGLAVAAAVATVASVLGVEIFKDPS